MANGKPYNYEYMVAGTSTFCVCRKAYATIEQALAAGQKAAPGRRVRVRYTHREGREWLHERDRQVVADTGC